MIIRSITFFVNLEETGVIESHLLDNIQRLHTALKEAFSRHGDEVQSIRLATNSFCEYLPYPNMEFSKEMSLGLLQQMVDSGINYLSMGPALPNHPDSYAIVPEILRLSGNIFMTGFMTDKNGIDLKSVRSCAEIIHSLSRVDASGLGNLFFAALANVPGGIPFLPAAYQEQNGVGFALAVEAADLAITAFKDADTLQDAKNRYVRRIEKAAKDIERMVDEVLTDGNFGHIHFYGLDLTPAPYITAERSVGTALEGLAGIQLGQHGSLASAAFLMNALDRAEFRRSGFNGLMLPVLEDAILARCVEEGTLSIKDLLLMSTVCGTGLDTIPLPGDTTIGQLQAVLSDVACLSMRLKKPLTVRLMPIPDKNAGEMTSFDFPFFVNTRVMPVETGGIGGLFQGDEQFQIKPKKE